MKRKEGEYARLDVRLVGNHSNKTSYGKPRANIQRKAQLLPVLNQATGLDSWKRQGAACWLHACAGPYQFTWMQITWISPSPPVNVGYLQPHCAVATIAGFCWDEDEAVLALTDSGSEFFSMVCLLLEIWTGCDHGGDATTVKRWRWLNGSTDSLYYILSCFHIVLIL